MVPSVGIAVLFSVFFLALSLLTYPPFRRSRFRAAGANRGAPGAVIASGGRNAQGWWTCVSVLVCGLSASEAICQIEQQEPSRSPISVDMRQAKPLGWQEEQALRPLDMFKECEVCPEMIVVPAGAFIMGAPETEDSSEDNERPEHKVTIAKAFAVGRFAVTFEEWDACVANGGCRRHQPRDRGWGRGRRPVINLSWGDAKVYTKWLSERTGKDYRFLSEAEREYVTRAGTNTPFWWGVSISSQQANYDGEFPYPTATGQMGEFRTKTVPVDFLSPTPGVYTKCTAIYMNG